MIIYGLKNFIIIKYTIIFLKNKMIKKDGSLKKRPSF